ncbi:hypothetical protein [Rathayibacter toxicus]|uniref:hypothetical protein n=1 Tax=Rathayibacter toxicus TaxID=145458 RepID=UPI0011AFDEF9|nr:hypothetical protein [Rathayibacter toxicus]QOD10196.1 hypothetical protein BSG36_09815 [Rathayibacter toxicus]QWL28872.1 hypothetical protein E2R33_09840 [Rathayibacter toxicus]
MSSMARELHGSAVAPRRLCIQRVAGLSAERVALVPAGVDELAARLEEVEVVLCQRKAAVSDILHDLVPLLDEDRSLRRAVLDVRRSTRKISPPPIPVNLIARITGALTERSMDADSVAAWAAIVQERAALERAHSNAVTSGVAHACAALELLRDDEAFLGAVADANPDFAAAPGRGALEPGRSSSRSLLAYAVRAAYKTSPFGTLTTVGLAGGASPSRPVVTITHAYAVAWLDALAHDETVAHVFEVEPLTTGGLVGQVEPVGIPAPVETLDVFWRQILRVALRESGVVLDELRGIGRVPLYRLLTIVGGDDPFACYLRMLDAGLLRVVAPWVYGERHSLNALAAWLAVKAPTHPAARLLAELVAETHAVTTVQGVERGRRRVALRDRAESALAGYGYPPAHCRFEAYCDAAPDVVVPGPAPELEAEIERYAAAVGRRLARSAAYDALVAAAVRRCGVGGVIEDPWRWLLTADADKELLTALSTPARVSRSAAEHPRGRSMSAPSAALAFQIVHGEDPLVVVNQLVNGQGGLITRFTELHGDLGRHIAERAQRLAGDAIAVEIVPSWDTTGMQAAAAGTLPRLSLPLDAPVVDDHREVIDFAALRLRHDPATESLELLTSSGVPVVPFSLGLVPGHLVNGPERLLAILADPWQLPHAGAPIVPTLADADAVASQPRWVNGRIVVRRAVWTVPDSLLPAVTSDDAALLRAVARWRRGHGIPPEVFVRLVRARLLLAPVTRKPLPVDLRSPHSLRMLFTLLDGARASGDVLGVEITEALPAPHQFAQVSDGSRRAVEYLVFLDEADLQRKTSR